MHDHSVIDNGLKYPKAIKIIKFFIYLRILTFIDKVKHLLNIKNVMTFIKNFICFSGNVCRKITIVTFEMILQKIGFLSLS